MGNEISKIAHQVNEDLNSAGKESLLSEIGPSILNSSDKESDIVSGKNLTKGISSSIDKENSTERYPKETSTADDRKLKHSRDMALGRNKSGRFWKSHCYNIINYLYANTHDRPGCDEEYVHWD